MLFNRVWFLIVMMLSIVALPIRINAASPTVIFSEIAWAGSSISSSDEWIELTNLSSDPIDLTGWTITGAGSSGKTLTLPEGSVIAPYSTYLITNYANGNASTALAVLPNNTTATLSLPNDGFSLALSDALGSQIDVAGSDRSPFAGGSGSTSDSADGRYRSMVRVDGLVAGSDEAAWSDATTSSGFLDGVQDLGTPGVVEAVEEVIEEAPSVSSDPSVLADSVVTEEAVEEAVVEVTPEVEEEVVEEDLSVPSDPEAQAEEEIVEVTETKEADVAETVAAEDPSDTSEPELLIEEEVVEIVETESIEAVETVQVVEAVSVFYSPGVILINEFVVDPLEDQTEWIELVNRSTETITLTGWTIEDATGKTTDLSSITLTPGSYSVVDSPKGKLNNDDDTITLRDATNLVIDTISYGSEAPEDGRALARNSSNTFELTETTTPGGPNVISVEEVSEEVQEVEEVDADTEIPVTTSDPTTLRFSSLYPNTTGDDELEEYIELTNTGDEQIDLLGWTIEDGSTDFYIISESQIVEPQDTKKIMRADSGIALNNTGDTLELRDPNEEVVDTVSYGNAAKGSTYTFMNDAWTWSGTVSVTEAVTTSSSTSAARTVSSAPASSASLKIQTLTIEQSKNLSDGKRVRVQGVITVLPGVFARQTFYVMDETGGIQIYFYDADFPELTIGQHIYVTGEMSTSHGERRIKIQVQTDIASAQQESTLIPVVISIPEINEDRIGSLVTTNGLVRSRENGKLIIEDAGSELVVSLKSDPEIDAARFERGDRIMVTGVLTSYDGELRIRPRAEDDILIDESAIVSLALSTDEDGKSLFEDSQTRTGLILLLVTAASLSLLAIQQYRSRRQLTLSTP